jgi:hypothetical protein
LSFPLQGVLGARRLISNRGVISGVECHVYCFSDQFSLCISIINIFFVTEIEMNELMNVTVIPGR